MVQVRGHRSWAACDRAENRLLRAAVPAALVALAACGGHSPVSAPTAVLPGPVTPRARVAIISIDGIRPDALGPGTPSILALAARGASTFRAQTVFPPITLPAHASMLSGFSVTQHGISWDEYLPERGTIAVPTIFSAATQAGRRCNAVVGKQKLLHLNAATAGVTFATLAREEDVATAAVAVAVQDDFDLLFVHLPQTDLTGHEKNWMSAAYSAQLAASDISVGRILAALPEGTTVILTGDHGGHANTHGAQVATDMTVPWIIAGPGVKIGYTLGKPVNVKDTASTAAYLLGLALAPNVEGRPVFEAFVGGVDSTTTSLRVSGELFGLPPHGGAERSPSRRTPFSR